MKNKLLLIGWDAADWKIINPLLDSGRMPALSKLISKGVIGNIATLDPPLSPMLWTSIATGKRAYQHGILNFLEPDITNNSVRPIHGSSRKVKAIWNILSESNIKSNVVGWWPSHPAEEINGISVSNHFNRVYHDKDKKLHFVPGSVFPESKLEDFKELLILPDELSLSIIRAFVPTLNVQHKDLVKQLEAIAKITAHTATLHAIATRILQTEDWEFMAVYFDAIDHFCHAYMRFYPPKQEHIEADKYELFKDVIPNAYQFHDMMLDRYMQLAGDDCTIMILSDHGFKADHQRLKWMPKEPAAPAYEHREFGIFVMSGPDTKKDERVYGATLLDVTPTILQHFNLPIGKDMAGRIIYEAFDNPVKPTYIETWENTETDSVKKYNNRKIEDPLADQLAIDQLVELGYVEKSSDLNDRIKKTTNETLYNLARSYMDGSKYEEADEILSGLITSNPEAARYLITSFTCSLILKRFENANNVIDIFQKAKFPHINLFIYKGDLLFSQNKINSALTQFHEAILVEKNNPVICYKIGRCEFIKGNYSSAESYFIRALSQDDNNASFYFYLGKSYYALGKFEECAAVCLEVINLRYYSPLAHLLLGKALFELEDYISSANAMELYLRWRPMHNKIRRQLISIYQDYLNDQIAVDRHLEHSNDYPEEWIYIVSGLPRSGTSMMMQMLNAGGMEVLSDASRNPDINNPFGYFEYEPVKRLQSDKSWLANVKGKVVKVIAQQLFHLPPKYKYKVIFMERKLEEIMISQDVMLGKKNAASQNTYNTLIAKSFKDTLEKIAELEKEPNFKFIRIPYAGVIDDTVKYLLDIENYLEQDLGFSKMQEAIHPELYRIKLNQE